MGLAGLAGAGETAPVGRDMHLAHAVEIGIRFVDTADSYGAQVAEDLLREVATSAAPSPDRAAASRAAHRPPDLWP